MQSRLQLIDVHSAHEYMQTSKETPEWSGGGEILIYLLIKEIKSSFFSPYKLQGIFLMKISNIAQKAIGLKFCLVPMSVRC